jgi:hypothetical protein
VGLWQLLRLLTILASKERWHTLQIVPGRRVLGPNFALNECPEQAMAVRHQPVQFVGIVVNSFQLHF